MSTAGVSHKRLIDEARELTTKVVRLKESQGISLAAIAGILSKEYGRPILTVRVQRLYYKYVKRKKDGKPEPQSHATQPPVGTEPYYKAGLPEVSIRERQFAKQLVEGVLPTEAARNLGIPNPGHWQHEALNKPAVSRFIDQMLDANGLTESYVAQVHKGLLSANRTIVATRDGKITDKLEVPDNNARMNAVKTAYEVRKRLGSNQEDEPEESAAATIIVLTAEKRTAIEGLIGGPLDCEVLDDPGNFAVAVGAGETKQSENSADEADPSRSSSATSAPEDPPAE